jgi:hypothetical protein
MVTAEAADRTYYKVKGSVLIFLIWCEMSSTKVTKETKLEIEKSKVGSTEIHEWHMELRTNNVCMDERNADVRMKKVEEIEKDEAQGRQDRERGNAERERTNLERETTNVARERANEEREMSNNIRELACDERECTYKDRKMPEDKREPIKDENVPGRRRSNRI